MRLVRCHCGAWVHGTSDLCLAHWLRRYRATRTPAQREAERIKQRARREAKRVEFAEWSKRVGDLW